MKNGNQYLTFVCEEALEKRDCAKDYRKMFFSFVFIVAFSAVLPFLLTVNCVNFDNFLGIIPLGISLFWWLISLCLASQFIKVCKCRHIFKKAFFSYLFVMIFLCLSFTFSIIPLFTNKTSFNQEGEMRKFRQIEDNNQEIELPLDKEYQLDHFFHQSNILLQ